jgi:hypothetical protein
MMPRLMPQAGITKTGPKPEQNDAPMMPRGFFVRQNAPQNVPEVTGFAEEIARSRGQLF